MKKLGKKKNKGGRDEARQSGWCRNKRKNDFENRRRKMNHDLTNELC